MTTADTPAVKATLDDLFRRALARRPDALALIDPPDRETFTDGPVRRLTYRQADRAISALAARLKSFGLPTDSVVAIQLPNTVESVIARPLYSLARSRIADKSETTSSLLDCWTRCQISSRVSLRPVLMRSAVTVAWPLPS